MLCGPTSLKGLLFTGLHLICPRLAITRSACLHGSRCGGGGSWSFSTRGLINRSLHDGGLHNWNLHHRSLSDRSRCSSHTRPTGAMGLGIWFHLRLPTGLAGGHLGPSGQGGPHQVQTLMEAALPSYQPMIIAPLFVPACEAPKAIQVEASGLIEEVLDIGHKVHWMGLLEGQGFLLILEEVVKELLLNPHPFCLPEGGNPEFVVDPEDMLQVLPPTTATKICCQPRGTTKGGPWPTSPLRLGSFRCWWWWDPGHQPGGQIALLMQQLHTRLPQHTSEATDGSAAASSPSRAGSSVVLCAHITHRGGFICGGISSDSPPCRLLWQLYHLLIRCGWSPWWQLAKRWYRFWCAWC